jgi:type IV pilus assembly protein PilX
MTRLDVGSLVNRPKGSRGAALVIGLLLLLVLTVLAITGLSTATLELRMAGNQQYQKRAFQFAEAGVEQAIVAGIYTTAIPDNYTPAAGTDPPEPIRGEGLQIENCPDDDDDPAERQCEFFIRFDQETGVTQVPGGGYSLGTGFEALHFVVDSYGVAERSAESEHQQSFYIVGPGGT